MAELELHRRSTDSLCARCWLPEDLLPIQQAIVLRSFPPAYGAMLDGHDGEVSPVRPLPPGAWSPLEHACYVGAMFGAVYIRLRQLLGRERPEPRSSIIERQGAPSLPEDQAALDRLSDQAERLARSIVSGAHGCDWRARPFHDQPSPHALIHLAIDEAAEHLREVGGAVLPDAPPLAVAAPGLLLDGRTVPGGTPDLAALPPGRRNTCGRLVRTARRRVR
jgi:hypothetical protein